MKRLDGRNGEVWRRYVQGSTEQRIAEEMELSQQRVSSILAEVRKSIPAPDRGELVAHSLGVLLELQREAWESVNRAPARGFVGKDGELARD